MGGTAWRRTSQSMRSPQPSWGCGSRRWAHLLLWGQCPAARGQFSRHRVAEHGHGMQMESQQRDHQCRRQGRRDRQKLVGCLVPLATLIRGFRCRRVWCFGRRGREVCPLHLRRDALDGAQWIRSLVLKHSGEHLREVAVQTDTIGSWLLQVCLHRLRHSAETMGATTAFVCWI